MPRIVDDKLQLTESELFDLEAELSKLKQIEGFNRKQYTTIDKCLLLVQMYMAIQAEQEELRNSTNEVDTLSIASDMGRIHELASQARDNDYFKDDLVRRIIDITLKYKA